MMGNRRTFAGLFTKSSKMKKMILIILCSIVFNLGVNNCPVLSNQDSGTVFLIYKQQAFNQHKQKLLKAVIYVESRGNPLAYNKKEKAAGIIQMRPVMVRHINRLSPEKFTLKDRYNPDKAIRMFHILMEKRNPSYNIDTACSLWNAGAIDADKLKPKVKAKVYKYKGYIKQAYYKI
jgi:soluble lytic murein transglycosylase-like protein